MSSIRPSARRLAVVLVTLLVWAGAGLVRAAPAQAGADCHVSWGSGPAVDDRSTMGPVVAARAGRNDCFDRFVVDLGSGPLPGFRIQYVDQVTADGSGATVPLRGGARLQVTVHAPAHDLGYRPTYRPLTPAEAVAVAGFTTFRQVAFAGSFEGITTFGLGVRARLPFHAFVLAGPGSHTRLVVDVAHRWG